MHSYFAGKRVFVLSHEMSSTGAPRVSVEFALLLSGAGARVTLSVPPDGAGTRTVAALAARAAVFGPGTELLSFDVAAKMTIAASCDLVVVSTADPRQLAWIAAFRSAHPRYPSLVWWVHEGPSVMSVFDPAVKARAIELMITPGMLNTLIFPSAETREWWYGALRAAAPSAPLPAAHVVHWGLPRWREAAFHVAARDSAVRAALRAEHGFTDDDFVFLVLASYHPIKGHAGIARAFRAARDLCTRPLRLVAAGAGLGEAGLFPTPGLEWVRDDPDMRLEGPTQRVAEYLAAADALISNTKAGGETWGLTTMEALAAGRPVLASRVGGALEQLEHNATALLHEVSRVTRPEDDDASEVPQLALHMCAVATDAALRERLAAAGMAHVARNLGQAHLELATMKDIARTLSLKRLRAP